MASVSKNPAYQKVWTAAADNDKNEEEVEHILAK